MILTEGNLSFHFENDCEAIKYDETDYYQNYFKRMDSGKGIDFIVKSFDQILLVEVKDCFGHEKENLWRTKSGFSKENNADCFDSEVSKKVAMTMAALMGAHTKPNSCDAATKLIPFFSDLSSKKISQGKKQIRVIFLLEGEFKSDSRSEKMIKQRIRDSIEKQLKWMECKVYVETAETINKRYEKILKVKRTGMNG